MAARNENKGVARGTTSLRGADYENPIRNSEFGLPGNFVIRPNPDTMEHVRGTRLTRAVAVAHAPI